MDLNSSGLNSNLQFKRSLIGHRFPYGFVNDKCCSCRVHKLVLNAVRSDLRFNLNRPKFPNGLRSLTIPAQVVMAVLRVSIQKKKMKMILPTGEVISMSTKH